MKQQRNTTLMKEKTRNTEVQINEEERGNLPEKEFRIMIVKMIINLENKMEKMQESINKKLEELKTKHTETKQYATNNQLITEETKDKIKKYLGTNDNKNTMTQNIWDAAKAVLSSHLKEQKISQTNNLNLHLKQLVGRKKKNSNKNKLVEGKKS